MRDASRRNRAGPSADVLERLTLDVLHDDEVEIVLFSGVVDLDDVRVLKLRGRQRLATEALDERIVARVLRMEDLERDLPAELPVLGE